MANREGKCPKCGGKLSIPEELLKFSCMYCGALLSQEELIFPGKEKNPVQEKELEEQLEALWERETHQAEVLIGRIWDCNLYNDVANRIYAKLHFDEILFQYTDAMEHFTRSGYGAYFEQYRSGCRPVLEAVDRYALGSEDRGEAFMRLLAGKLFSGVDEVISADKSLRTRSARSFRQDQYKMILAVYTIPMVRSLKLASSEKLADIMVEEWMRLHPKSAVRKGTYEEMEAGFRKKMCFITTAVCDSFGKPDDCYELTSFRNFRDTYMMERGEGRRLVEEYYNVAPGIVTCIDLEPDREAIYKSIWDRYLSRCQKELEKGEREACELHYRQMVERLKKRYLSRN